MADMALDGSHQGLCRGRGEDELKRLELALVAFDQSRRLCIDTIDVRLAEAGVAQCQGHAAGDVLRRLQGDLRAAAAGGISADLRADRGAARFRVGAFLQDEDRRSFPDDHSVTALVERTRRRVRLRCGAERMHRL